MTTARRAALLLLVLWCACSLACAARAAPPTDRPTSWLLPESGVFSADDFLCVPLNPAQPLPNPAACIRIEDLRKLLRSQLGA